MATTAILPKTELLLKAPPSAQGLLQIGSTSKKSPLMDKTEEKTSKIENSLSKLLVK